MIVNPPYAQEVRSLLAEVRAAKVPLSQSVAETARLAQEIEDPYLENFCRKELTGWTVQELRRCPPDDQPAHRSVHLYASEYCLNLTSFPASADLVGFVESQRNDFVPVVRIYPLALPDIESESAMCRQRPSLGLIMLTVRCHRFGYRRSKARTSNKAAYYYSASDLYERIEGCVRDELIRRLSLLLPDQA